MFRTQLDSLDALVGDGKGGYATGITTLAGEVGTLMEALLDAAVADNLIASAHATFIGDKFATGPVAVNKEVAGVNVAAQYKTFGDGREALLTAEKPEAGIGNLSKQLDVAQSAVGASSAKIRALAESVSLATAKDDIFPGSTAKVSLQKFGSQGEDYLCVGAGLTYNDTEIGSDTGQATLVNAGDDKVRGVFVQQSGINVIVHVEQKPFGSTSGTATNMVAITLVGVDLGELVV